MVILHITELDNNFVSGMRAVIPEHVFYLNQIAQSKVINCNHLDLGLADLQLPYTDPKTFLDALPIPFNHPDLVVFQGVNCLKYITMYKVLLEKGIKYIVVPHGQLNSQALRRKWLKKKIAYLLFFNRFVNRSSGIQCLSESEKSNIHDFTVRKFIGTNGIKKNDFCKKNFNEKGMRLFYVGRLDILAKGLDNLLNAVVILKEFMVARGIVVHLYGPDQDNSVNILTKLIQQNSLDNIVFIHGAVFGAEKDNAIAENDIFIQVSRQEGMPVGILEMLNKGVPCILSTGTTLTDGIDRFNYGYHAGDDVNSIAAAIEKAVADRENWLIKSKNAKNYAETKYDWENVALDILAQYTIITERHD